MSPVHCIGLFTIPPLPHKLEVTFDAPNLASGAQVG